MLRHLRWAAFHLQQSSGIFRWVADSTWRNNRLLILCYHGISRIDEHLWRPGLYMQPEIFRQRLQILQEGKYNVLPLGEGFGACVPGICRREVWLSHSMTEATIFTKRLSRS